MFDACETRRNESANVYMLTCLHRNWGKNQSPFWYEIFNNSASALPEKSQSPGVRFDLSRTYFNRTVTDGSHSGVEGHLQLKRDGLFRIALDGLCRTAMHAIGDVLHHVHNRSLRQLQG